MSDKRTAYPVPAGNGTHFVEEDHYGLTRRELFAAMAMQGFAAADECFTSPEYMARTAVRWADALIAELDRPSG